MSLRDSVRRPASGGDNGIASPCVRLCCLDDNDTCRGCFRTLEEIAAWSASSDSAKRTILARAAQRRSGYRDA